MSSKSPQGSLPGSGLLRSESSPPGPLSLMGEGERKAITAVNRPSSPVTERGPGGEDSERRALRQHEVWETLQVLAREAPVDVVVRGDCMLPLLADGDQVRVAAARLYWPGDVLVFRAPDGRLLAHRLLGYRRWAGGRALVTRGDACVVHDAPVPLGAVLGRIDDRRPAAAVRLRSLLRFLALLFGRLRRLGR